MAGFDEVRMQDRTVRAAGCLQSRRHFARMQRIDAMVVFAGQKKNRGIGRAVFDMVEGE